MNPPRRTLIPFCLALLAFAGCRAVPQSKAAPPAELAVETLAKNPAAYAGQTIVLRGVVSSVEGRQRMFTVIDEAEYQACRELGCASYEVPVAFAGALPETAQVVRVRGRLERSEPGQYLVRAEHLEAAK